MYRVIFQGVSGGWQMSDDFNNIENAREFKVKLINVNYEESKIHIITIVE